jgi:hypothetical protein
MAKSAIKIKIVRGEPVIELRPESEPAAWLALLTYAEWHEQIDDKVATLTMLLALILVLVLSLVQNQSQQHG